MWALVWLGWIGCGGPAETVDLTEGPLGLGAANPFPSLAQLDSNGQLALRGLPNDGDTPIPVDSLAWRTGFSPGQVAVLDLPGIDPSGFPSFVDPEPGVGSVRLADLTDLSWLPCMAELDAHPDAVDQPSLLVRPLRAMTPGHRVAVVVTTDAVPRPETFDPTSVLHAPLLEELVALGQVADDVAVAWEFPIGDGTSPLLSALEQRRTADFPAPSFDDVREAALPPRTYRVAVGAVEVTRVVDADGRLALTETGAVEVQDTPFEADVYVHVPVSVQDAPAGTVPVVVFGHGLFRSGEDYFDSPTDEDGVLQLADELGAIVVSTRWRGLSNVDLGVALEVAGDFGNIPKMTGLLVQSQLAVREITEALRDGGWFDDPVFAGASGQSLPDADQLTYYGISLGGIEGAVLMAQAPPVQAAVLHVPGAMWGTMLERSSNWELFEALFVPAVPNPTDRQLLYALSQLWWDPVDPIHYTTELATAPVLLQVSVGDEQVPNLVAEALVRSAGLPLVEPLVTNPGLEVAALPVEDGTAAMVQFDPEVPLPDPTNRPAEVTNAHTLPRLWSGQRGQVVTFLNPDRPGHLVHLCGDTACSASNPGP